jgi:phosphohistidine phosphatase
MFIYIVRHAWAYQHGDPRWPDDSQRPLEMEGAERFVRVIQALASRGFEPAAIATSPYVRCRQTAELIATHVPGSLEVCDVDALRPGGDFDGVVEWSKQFAHRESLCWVGHAPDVNNLAATLLGDGAAAIRFSKGAVAAIRIHVEIEPGAGELHWLATAKLLGV